MIGEIDRDFYCSAVSYSKHHNFCRETAEPCYAKGCNCYHRKHPTPEQFKEEYGEEWEGTMYYLLHNFTNGTYRWDSAFNPEIERVAHKSDTNIYAVCACTPWGKPPADWRPE